MPSKSVAPPKTGELYERDFLIWTEDTARLLRAGRFDEVDVEHIAEEIEDMGKSRRHELHSRLTTLLWHLLKWKYQPEKRSTSWRLTILEQRRELGYLLEESPSLRPAVSKAVGSVYSHSVKGASTETDLPCSAFPDHCPFAPEQILDEDFLPD